MEMVRNVRYYRCSCGFYTETSRKLIKHCDKGILEEYYYGKWNKVYTQ